MDLYERKGVYGVEIYVPHPDKPGEEKRIRRSLGTRDETQARILAPEKVAEIMAELRGETVENSEKRNRGYTLKQALAAPWATEWHSDVHNSTKKTKSNCKILEEEFGSDTLAKDITYDVIKAKAIKWRDQDQLAPATVNRRLDTLSVALNEAFKDGKLTRPPVMFKFKGIKNTSDRYMSNEEEVLALKHLKELHRASQDPLWLVYECLFMFLLDTGARLSEALGTEFRDIDSEGYIHFERYSTKTCLPRKIPLSGRVKAQLPLLQRLSTDGSIFCGINANKADRLWNKLRMCVDTFTDLTMHKLRHTCGTRLALAGVPLSDVADWLGHSDLNTTRKRYIHLYDQDKGSVLRVLESVTPGFEGVNAA